MAYFEMKDGSYEQLSDMRNLVKYVMNADYIGAYGLITLSAEAVLNQILTIKNIYHKTDGRQLRHIIVSFSDDEDISIEEAYFLGYKIAAYYGKNYQIVFGVHGNTDNTHIHFCLNTVSYNTGLKYADGMEDYNNLDRHIDCIMDEHCSAC